MNIFYRPSLIFFLLPLFSIIFGAFFSLSYETFSVLSLVILYLFIISNQMLENIMMRIPKDDFKLPKNFIIILNSLNGLILLYFGLLYSWIAAVVLFLYALFVQTQFIFSYYDLEYLARFITSLFKVVLLNVMSFYSQTRFIQPSHILYYLGIFIPFYLYEIGGLGEGKHKKWLPVLIGFNYIIGIALLWPLASWWSFILLISLPFAWVLLKDFSRMLGAVYAGMFALIYFITLIIHI